MTAARIGELVAACVGLVAVGVQLRVQSMVGWPDGAVTALERAMRFPHQVVTGVLVLVAVALMRGPGPWRGPLIAAVVVLGFLGGWGLDWLGAEMGLDHGQGG